MKNVFLHTLILYIASSICWHAVAQTQNKRLSNKPKATNTQGTKSQAKLRSTAGHAESAPVVIENDQIVVKERKPENEFVEKVNEQGQVNWTQRYIEAKGSSVIDNARFTNPAQAKLMAQRGAMVDAQRNLLEIIQGVQVQGRTTVQDMITVSDEVRTKVDGVIKNAQMVGEPIESNGLITVTMRVPLYENGVADAVIESLPREKPATPGNTHTDAMPVAIQVNGSYKPTLFPKLTDEQNKVLIDLAESYGLPANKLPEIIKVGKETAEKLKGKKGIELIEVVQDQAGNLVLDTKNKAKLERWKKVLSTGFKILRTILLPV